MIAKGGVYELGTGDYRPRVIDGRLIDVPWTENGGPLGSDCAGFAISWCYKLRRHRPGFNVGAWSSVSDDLNCNSAIEDADHEGDLFERVTTPAPGVLLVYPTIRLVGHPNPWIGHVAIVTSVVRCREWDNERPDYSLLDVAQCCGPNGRGPAVIASDGSIWNHHDHTWPKPEHRTVMLRVKP
jgi:hypothetical protein